MDIVCIARPTWSGNYQKSTVLLMTELARTNNILYVNPQPTFKDVVTTALGRKSELNLSRLLNQTSRLELVQTPNGSSVYVLHPRPGLPINWLDNVQSYERWTRFNANRLVEDILAAMTQLTITQPVVVNAFQPAIGLAIKGRLNERLLIYYCYDEISAAFWCRKHGTRTEKIFLGEVNAVITSSKALREAKQPFAKQVFWVPNGVNFALFNEAIKLREQWRSEPLSATNQTNGPVVGYVGSIDDRLDLPLIQYCLQAMPNSTFWFVGRVVNQTIAHALAQYPNVRLMGAQKPEALPRLMAQMNVAIIPFVRNTFTQHIYPLKINEYLAAGLPVVATPFADLTDFIQAIDIATDQYTFLQLLTEAIQSPANDLKHRIATALGNDWSHRAAAFESVLKNLLPISLFNQDHETGIVIG